MHVGTRTIDPLLHGRVPIADVHANPLPRLRSQPAAHRAFAPFAPFGPLGVFNARDYDFETSNPNPTHSNKASRDT